MKRLALIGLDCADPVLLRELLPELPALRELVENGSFARLRSVDPPITIPAWMCMMTGKDPGELGVYGFRNRRDHSYDGLQIVNSTAFAGAEPVWDTLGRHGILSIVLGVPGTFPPRPIAGALVSGFLAPNAKATYTYPASLAERIRDWIGEYVFDVRQFRTDDKAYLYSQVREMTEKRFAVARRLVADREWRFFAMVEIGPDRIHHGMWAHHDPTHPQHDSSSPFRDTLRDYYQFLDRQLSDLLNELPSSTEVLIVSDHGAQKMEGGVAINEWLIRNNYLALTEYPNSPTRMHDLIERGQIDWSKTTAWGEGGYYGRLFLNVVDREPGGIVPQQDYRRIRDRLVDEIASIPDETGTPLGSRAQRPEEIYRTVTGIPPDLIVYFGDLRWRSIGTVGWNRIHIHENDTGPDDANHSLYGVYISSTPGKDAERRLLDIRHEVLGHFGIEGQA
jgi:predicted AlkP superfamily phosphohydrolase/phosphomutase